MAKKITDKIIKNAKGVADAALPALTVIKRNGDSVDGKTAQNIKNKTGSDYNAYLTEKSRRDYINSLNSFGSGRLDELYGQIVNRGDFTYDPASDALYGKYRQIYEKQGQKAMENVMGQAAALTGGYDSSYAQSQGEKQYSSYLSKLNDMIPSLYQKAYDRYVDEGRRLEELYDSEKQRQTEETGRLKSIYENEKSTYEDVLKKENEKKAEAEKKKQEQQKAEKEKKANQEKAEKEKKANQEKAAAAEQKAARDNAMMLLKAGRMPDSETLRVAGIPESYAEQIAAYYRSLINKRLYG